jgi:hypothetical protein
LNSYWLDSDVLVYAKDEIAPIGYAEYAGFWSLLERNMAAGVIKITRGNYREITENRESDDELASWLKLQLRKDFGVCVAPSKEVQAFVRKIGDYVYSNEQFYARHRARFSRGADAWIVGQAAIDQGTVVTREIPQPTSHDIKIPDLCDHFGVKRIAFSDLMKTLATKK